MAYNNSHSVILGQISSYLDRCCRNAYEQGKADGAREFAEWLCKGVVPQDNPHVTYSVREMLNDGSSYEVEADDLIAEWQKEQ